MSEKPTPKGVTAFTVVIGVIIGIALVVVALGGLIRAWSWAF